MPEFLLFMVVMLLLMMFILIAMLPGTRQSNAC